MHSKNDWFILGAGAIGSLWAVSLKESGQACYAITKSCARDKYAEKQFTLKENRKKITVPIQCVSADQIDHPIYKLIVSVKANDAVEAIKSIKYALEENATVILLMNGMGFQHEIHKLLKDQHIWTGSTTDGAWKEAPFSVNRAGRGITWLGHTKKIPAKNPLPLIPRLDVALCDDIDMKVWHKCAINGIINGLTALYQCKNGELLSCNQRRQRLKRLADECTSLLRKKAVPVAENLFEMSLSVIKKTANNFSSTLQDAMKGKPTELQWINGFLINEAKSLGMKLYAHEELMIELHSMNIY